MVELDRERPNLRLRVLVHICVYQLIMNIFPVMPNADCTAAQLTSIMEGHRRRAYDFNSEAMIYLQRFSGKEVQQHLLSIISRYEASLSVSKKYLADMGDVHTTDEAAAIVELLVCSRIFNNTFAPDSDYDYKIEDSNEVADILRNYDGNIEYVQFVRRDRVDARKSIIRVLDEKLAFFALLTEMAKTAY